MEYRFFYSINQNIFDNQWRKRTDLENRTDIYFILPRTSDDFHLEHGLKLRNRKKLELKKREQRFPNGLEYWMKTIQSDKKLRIDDIDSILKVLKKSNENQLMERLNSSQPMILCYVSKFREQKAVGKSLMQEQTGLHLKFIRANDQSQIGNDLFFETICIEQSSSKLIDEKTIENLLKDHGNISIDPMGYPEFLFRQYQQIMNQ